ncbi:MAG: Ig-like domain repeat protein [Dictyoglomaceae bacterium]
MKRTLIFSFVFFTFILSFSFAQSIQWKSGYPRAIPDGKIELSWTSTISGSYSIYRVKGEGNPYPNNFYTQTTLTTYTDTNTEDGVLYSYVVAIYDGTQTRTTSIGSAKADRTKPIIDNLNAVPNPFSPDGDGFRDKITISFNLSEYSIVTITLQDKDGNIYTPPEWNNTVCPTPKTYYFEWDGYGVFGGTYRVPSEGFIIYTITARDYAGNINSATGRFILDIPDIELANFYGMPNPFNTVLLSDTIYRASYSRDGYKFPKDESNNIFNFSPQFYLDQSAILLVGASFQFDILQRPGGSSNTLKNTRVKIYDSKGVLVRSITLPTNLSGSGNFYWYGEKDPQLIKDDPNIITSWWWMITGVPSGEYRLVLSATYTMAHPDDPARELEIPLKEVTTIIRIQEISPPQVDTTPPRVISFTPEDGSLVSQISSVSAVLDDGPGVGPDLDASSILVKDNLGRLIGGIKSHNGVNTLYWSFTSTLTSGQYFIEVIPIDKNGNIGSLARSSFIIDNSPPQILNVYPTGNVVSVNQIRVSYNDIGSGLDFWDNYPLPPSRSHVKIYTPNLEEITLLFDKNLSSSIYAIANIPQNILTRDGKYDLVISLIDKAGNSSSTYTYFVLDRTAPYIISTSLTQTLINYTLSQIKITVKDDTVGIHTNTQKTFLELKDSTWNQVPSTLTLNIINSKTVELVLNISSTYTWIEGDYYLTIKASDLLENVLYLPQKFTLDLKSPQIINISPTGNVKSVEKIEVGYSELMSGIDFIRSRATVTFQGSSTSTSFIPSESTATKLVARFGQEVFSVDGTYNIEVVIYDQAGNSATAGSIFTLDRKGPKIKEVSPTRNSILVIGPQNVWARVEDENLGIDFGLAKTFIKLYDPKNQEILGAYTYEKSIDDKTGTLTLQISSYTWTNGIYTVRVKVSDKLDNITEETYTFRLQQVSQEIGDLVVSHKVFSPNKGDLRIDYQFQGVSGNIQRVEIEIYSLNGKLVKKISSQNYNAPQVQGTVYWDGKDERGKLVPNGYYLVKAIITESGGKRVRFKGLVVMK